VLTLNNAEGLVVNCDFFSVKINTLPSGYNNNPSGFLEYLRKNINSFTDQTYANFAGHPQIPNEETKWTNDPYGSIVFIDVIGPANGSVITAQKSTESWTWSTIREPYAGFHPVSGNRTFGYTTNSDGSYTYYCKGVDRVTSSVQEVLGKIMSGYQDQPVQFTMADGLWGSWTKKIKDYVNGHNGTATLQQPVTKRPNWYDVQDVLNGIKALNEINCP
jgi:hypothetical protein